MQMPRHAGAIKRASLGVTCLLLGGAAKHIPSDANESLNGVIVLLETVQLDVERKEKADAVPELSRAQDCLQQLKSLSETAPEQNHLIAIIQCLEVFAEDSAAMRSDLAAIECDVAQLEERVTQLGAEVDELTAQSLRGKTAVMLRQVAYRLNDFVAKYVYKQHLHTTLFEIRVEAGFKELSNDEQTRCDKALVFLLQQGYTIMKLSGAQQMLERPMFANGCSVAQQSECTVDKSSLLTLAAILDDADDTAIAVELIELLCLITGDQQPLTATVDLGAVIDLNS
jgi:hypothetical protein